jgi:hypothetical protein
MGLWDKAKNAAEKAVYTQEYSEQEAISAASEMRHDLNDPNELRQIAPVESVLAAVKEDEKIRFLISGTDFDIDDNDQGSQVKLIVTDKRLIILSSSMTLANNKYTISYNEIIGVGKSKRLTTQIRIQASGGQEYKISASQTPGDVAKKCTDFIRKKYESAGEEESSGEKSPLDKLEQLGELNENGVISDDEFERKKSELMDQV